MIQGKKYDFQRYMHNYHWTQGMGVNDSMQKDSQLSDDSSTSQLYFDSMSALSAKQKDIKINKDYDNDDSCEINESILSNTKFRKAKMSSPMLE